MKKTGLALFGLLMILVSFNQGKAQDLKTEVYVKENVPQKKAVPYNYVREGDVMWSTTIWRMIDLREKMNLPLYYPTKPIGNRMNLTDLLLFGIDNEGLTAYDPNDPLNEFKMQMTKEQIDAAMDAGIDTIRITDVNTNELITKIVPKERRTDQVKQVLVKEKWFFDKNHSTMQVRIIGLCPIRMYYRPEDIGNPDAPVQMKQTFWIYYPEARNILANHEIFNRNNDAQQISFDDFFWQRRFSSFIFKESNVYDNRRIGEYTMGLESLYESERIKNYLFNFEHDLWEY